MNEPQKHAVKWGVDGRPGCACGFRFVACHGREEITKQFHRHLQNPKLVVGEGKRSISFYPSKFR